MNRFELKKEHLELLKHAYIEFEDCETGAAAINPKRPYGNSDVAGDVANILNIKLDENDEDQTEKLLKLHYETTQALQILVQHAKIELGLYIDKGPYKNEWQKIK